jgi:hypothetical protein
MFHVERVLRSGVRAGWLVTVVGLLFVGVPGAMAQFGLKLPKVPKIGKQEPKPPAQGKALQGPAPEVTAITPNSVPAGWEGDVTLTGKNFAANMKLRLNCENASVTPRDVRVESGERLTFHLRVPPSAEESKCLIALEVPPAPPTAETGPAVQGSPLVVQVTGATFTISESSTLAKAYQACFLAEGDIPPMELMVKLSEAMQKGSQDECKLFVSADSVKYSDQGKPVLDQPASAVKTVEPVLMMGQPMGIFRIVLTSGKIYNFMASGGHNQDNPINEQIKRKLKK